MTVRRVAHLLAVAAVPVFIVACGGSDSSGPSTTQVNVTPGTAFATIPPPTTATTVPGGGPSTTAGQLTYTVAAGDIPITVAKRFGVTVEALNAANAGTAGYNQFYVGLAIIIPAGGTGGSAAPASTAPGGTATTAPGSSSGSGTTTATTTGGATTAPGSTTAGGQCPGKYKITAEDTSRIKVAQKFGITVEALDAANSATSGYNAFYPGLEIVIPC
jgi:LysM repeat protein